MYYVIVYNLVLYNSPTTTLSTFAVYYCSTVENRTVTTQKSMMGPFHLLTKLTSSVLSTSAVCMGHPALAGIPSFQRAPLSDVLNCFGVFRLIWFVWVYVCVLTISRAEGKDREQEEADTP